eukprot:TRINITY_DN1817_c0_g1_i1.p2 TRINITY_DN1817_c0_g1~~TRINITY_DN1817_c0_g1_i1.p2  ORF type:complete len:104 (+),score=10.87 TRINITY_DN1817_c0_g1_i1:375-686(+)
MAFHTAVWLTNYASYVQWLSEIETFGNPSDYSGQEMNDFFARNDAYTDSLVETHNYLPGAKDDTNLYTFMMIQFDWGKRIVTFYNHPATDNKGGRATKNTMGR